MKQDTKAKMAQRTDKDQMILKLLMQVSDRLKSSENERKLLWQELEEYRQIITDLEDKSSKTEKAYLSLEHRMGQQKSSAQDPELNFEYRKKIETLLRDAKRERELLNNKIETASETQKAIIHRLEEHEEQNERLSKKVEKVQSDKRRMLDRISKVEDTVVFTKQALDSKAMVLLTDQSAAAQVPAKIDDNYLLESPKNDNGSKGGRFFKSQAAVAASFVVMSLFAGIGIGQIVLNNQQGAQSPQIALIDREDYARLALQEKDWKPAIEGSQIYADADSMAQVETAAGVNRTVSEVKEAKPAISKALPVKQKSEESMKALMKDVDEKLASVKSVEQTEKKPTKTSEQLVSELLAQPERGAEAERIIHVSKDVKKEVEVPKEEPVREIVPGTENVKSVEQVIAKQAPSKVTSDSDLGAIYKSARVLENQAIAQLKTRQDKAPLTQRMKPDSALPSILKEIEGKAYEGMAEAQHDLGAIYTAGHAGVERNFDRAVFWFKESAFRGIANARYNLGVLYHQGLGIDKDMAEAILWYQAASYLGHPEAQYNLGIAYIEGIGTSYDPKMAAAYFEQAAMGGVVEAAYNLGLIYENALLDVAQFDEALFWYKIAADQGNTDAVKASEALAKQMGFNTDDVQRLVDQMKMLKPAFVENQATVQKQQESAADKRKELIRQIQEHLADGGFYQGNADGITGPMTEEAIESYQAQKGLEIDGQPTEELLVYMLAEALNYTTRPAAGAQ